MPSPDTSAQDAPKTTDYCDICGESPQSATHEGMPGGHAWTRRAASQEAEARAVVDAVLRATVVAGWKSNLVDSMVEEWRLLHDAYAAVIRASERTEQQGREWEIAESEFQRGYAAGRASERERYEALVEAASEIHPLQATGPEWWRCAICGHKERQLTRDPAAMHDANCAWLALRAALAALEEAGSA